MTRFEAITENSLFEAVKSAKFGANIVSHPSRSSMGQVLAGTGKLVFEGELLEMPLNWRPIGTRH